MNNYKLNDWEARNFIRNLQDKLGVPHGTPVEIIPNPNGPGVIVKRVLTPAEKTRNWVNKELSNIPKNVKFFIDGKTVIAFWRENGRRYCNFATCSPDDKFDVNIGKVIAWTRAKNSMPPKFIYE